MACLIISLVMLKVEYEKRALVYSLILFASSILYSPFTSLTPPFRVQTVFHLQDATLHVRVLKTSEERSATDAEGASARGTPGQEGKKTGVAGW